MTHTDQRDPAESSWLMRRFYRDWRPTRTGKMVNRVMGWWSAMGLPPKIQAAIEVRGRTSGRRRTTPIVIAKVDGASYLVSMLGPGSEWVKNVEAAGGEALIRQGKRRAVRLIAVPPADRAPILKEYVRIAKSGGRHFPLTADAPLEEYAAIAARYPVFRIDPA